MSYKPTAVLIPLVFFLSWLPAKASLPDAEKPLTVPSPVLGASTIDQATVIDLFHMVQREALQDLTATTIEEVNLAVEAFTTLVNTAKWNDEVARDFLMKILARQTGDYPTFRHTYEKYFPRHTSQELVHLIQGKTYVGSLSRAKGGAFYNLETKKGTYRKLGLKFVPVEVPGMTSIQELTLRSNALNHLPDMEPWKHLTGLWIYENALQDLGPLTSLQKLVQLTTRDNKITTLTALGKLTNLESLCVSRNPLTSLEPLLSLLKLTRLYTNHLGMEKTPLDVHSIAQMTQLIFVSLASNNLTQTEFLLPLTRLTTVVLSQNKLTTLYPLPLLTNLTNLYLDDNHLSTVTPLTCLTALENFAAQGNPGNSIETLSQLQRLRLDSMTPPKAPAISLTYEGKTPESSAAQFLPPSPELEAKTPASTAQQFLSSCENALDDSAFGSQKADTSQKSLPSPPDGDPAEADVPPPYQNPSQQAPKDAHTLKRLGQKLTGLFG